METRSPLRHAARDLAAPLLRRRWLIIGVVVASTAGTYVVSSLAAERFRASSTMLVSSSAVQGVVDQPLLTTPERATADQAQLAASRRVAQRVADRLGLDERAADIAGDISAVAATGSNLVTITAERASARSAALVADATVDEYIALQAELLERELGEELAKVRRQLGALPRAVSSDAQRRVLLDAIGRLEAAAAVPAAQARAVDRAVIPEQPFTPRPARDALFALVISALLGVALVLGLDRLERRPASAEARGAG